MYCTVNDLKKVYPEDNLIGLTDTENQAVIDEDKISEAIAGAQGEIDSYLTGRYTTPLSTVPAIIKQWTIDIAVYILFKNKPGLADIPTSRRDAYIDARKSLERISDGKMSLPITDSSGDFASGVLSTSHFEDD